MSLEEYFSTGPTFERPIFDAVMRHLEGIGPVHVEPVAVGIFLKRARSFVELRPKTKWVAMCLFLPHPVQHRLITRKVMEYNGTYYAVANLKTADDVNPALCALLTEAYLNSPE